MNAPLICVCGHREEQHGSEIEPGEDEFMFHPCSVADCYCVDFIPEQDAAQTAEESND